jgi:hypothetical protein
MGCYGFSLSNSPWEYSHNVENVFCCGCLLNTFFSKEERRHKNSHSFVYIYILLYLRTPAVIFCLLSRNKNLAAKLTGKKKIDCVCMPLLCRDLCRAKEKPEVKINSKIKPFLPARIYRGWVRRGVSKRDRECWVKWEFRKLKNYVYSPNCFMKI